MSIKKFRYVLFDISKKIIRNTFLYILFFVQENYHVTGQTLKIGNHLTKQQSENSTYKVTKNTKLTEQLNLRIRDSNI